MNLVLKTITEGEQFFFFLPQKLRPGIISDDVCLLVLNSYLHRVYVLEALVLYVTFYRRSRASSPESQAFY
jgi:hypothetical protein